MSRKDALTCDTVDGLVQGQSIMLHNYLESATIFCTTYLDHVIVEFDMQVGISTASRQTYLGVGVCELTCHCIKTVAELMKSDVITVVFSNFWIIVRCSQSWKFNLLLICKAICFWCTFISVRKCYCVTVTSVIIVHSHLPHKVMIEKSLDDLLQAHEIELQGQIHSQFPFHDQLTMILFSFPIYVAQSTVKEISCSPLMEILYSVQSEIACLYSIQSSKYTSKLFLSATKFIDLQQ